MKNVDQQNVTPYFLSLDGFRLLASINIVLFHLEYIGGFTDMGGTPGWFFRLIKGPMFHASIFFLLGGFIFTTKFSPHAQSFKTWPFFLKRLRELYPLHLITTLSMVILTIIRGHINGTFNVLKLAYSTFLHLTFLWPFFPFNTYTLNAPSWALAAFFLCYAFFGIMLRFVNSFSSPIHCILLIISCFIPIALWDTLYALLGAPGNLYQFFHIFAPVRMLEFLAGMFLARLFQCSKSTNIHQRIPGFIADSAFLMTCIIIYHLVGMQSKASAAKSFFSYHVLLPFFFLLIVSLISIEKGLICRLLSWTFIRKIGRSSFYPYLLHIPLVSWITFIAEHFFHEKRLLHKPLNIWIFIVLLYGSAFLYVTFIKKKTRVQRLLLNTDPVLVKLTVGETTHV